MSRTTNNSIVNPHNLADTTPSDDAATADITHAVKLDPAPLKPHVYIIMGSDSDWPILSQATLPLDMCQIPYAVQVISAHRTPVAMVDFAQSARNNGVKVIIAGAGGAAHLPGMVAALTTLPVIGVPVSLARLDGLDSLLSIVQMPTGVPVATVAINGAYNAGLLASQILAVTDADIALRLQRYRDEIADQVQEKNLQVQESVSHKNTANPHETQ